MENKMPFLGIINCRNLWKIDYHLQAHGLHDILDEFRAVRFDPAPFLLHIGV